MRSTKNHGQPETPAEPAENPKTPDETKDATNGAEEGKAKEAADKSFEEGKAAGVAQERDRVLSIIRGRDEQGQPWSLGEIKRRINEG